MDFVFDNDRPIYKQLVDQLRLAIVTEFYSSGDKLPSVREFSSITRVNPNTIQRALMELEGDGLIYTMRTSGKYVTDDLKKLESSRIIIINELLNDCVLQFDKLNISNDEVIKFIKEKRKDR